jgi:transcription initiation factor TFIID subunit 1
MKFDDYPPDIQKASVVFQPPAELGKNILSKNITVKQPKGLLDQQRHVQFSTFQEPAKKMLNYQVPRTKSEKIGPIDKPAR